MTNIFDAVQDIDGQGKRISSNESFRVESTWTFVAGTTGAIGQHTLFTVTGNVLVQVFGVCDTSLNSGGAATLSIGTANNVAKLHDDRVYTATEIDDGDLVSGNLPESPDVSTLPGVYLLNDGADITLDILVATITAGVIDFYCLWRPLSSNGNVEATTPA